MERLDELIQLVSDARGLTVSIDLQEQNFVISNVYSIVIKLLTICYTQLLEISDSLEVIE